MGNFINEGFVDFQFVDLNLTDIIKCEKSVPIVPSTWSPISLQVPMKKEGACSEGRTVQVRLFL